MYAEKAREGCLQLLSRHDRSSLILSKYVPPRALDGWLALRAFAIDTAKVVDGMKEYPIALARLQFWKTGIQQLGIYNRAPNDAASLLLLHKAVNSDNCAIHKRYLLTLLQTRESQLQQKPIIKLGDLARIGEGTHSQILYATLDMLQAFESGTSEFLAQNADLDEIVSEIIAHIGQAAGIAGGIRALGFYSQRQNRVVLPTEILRKRNIVDQAVIDGFEKGSMHPQLKDAVFDVATAANDHLLTARSKLALLKENTGSKVPPSLLITAMAAVPIQLYLERLEKHDFDVLKQTGEWRLPWRSWRSYRTKSF